MKKAVLALILTMAVASQILADEIDEAREIIKAKENVDVVYLSRINLGIPGGDNWIANGGDWKTYIYTINNDKEARMADGLGTVEPTEIEYWDKNSQSYIYMEYDIIQDIPGTRIGKKAASFGDYNGDGIDEIFHIDPAIVLSCSIWGYNSDNGERVFFLKEGFEPISPKGPAPVVFANYGGTDGILIHKIREERYAWFFYVWYEESRKYEELDYIWEDQIDFSEFPIVRKKGESQNNSEQAMSEASVAENKHPEAEEEFTDDSGKDSRFIFYIAIAVGVTALALAVFFAVRRKKG